MYEWNEAIQKMIDCIEDNLCENPSLRQMSERIGYSPYYCSVRFHEITGMTIRSYTAGRRLCLAALALRDTDERIIDIAVRCGYSSQEALTRAFRAAFGCTPAAYRKNPVPIPLSVRQVVYFPEHYRKRKGEMTMSNTVITEARVGVEFIPAHKYLGIWEERAKGYGDMWRYHDCDKVCGIVDSISHISDLIVTPHTAGWFKTDCGRGYFYGTGVPLDYTGNVPDGFELREFPGSCYLVFSHPPFDYLKDNGEVMGRVENLARNYDISGFGGGKYDRNEDVCRCCQRHYPECLGYQVLRPIKRK
ncbi:MAG: AraC family transcriptional regulator [Ruminococcus sp.]|nr:AraC family transcriptional regulator [Ruminococcus sp.]